MGGGGILAEDLFAVVAGGFATLTHMQGTYTRVGNVFGGLGMAARGWRTRCGLGPAAGLHLLGSSGPRRTDALGTGN